jgi:hypothetical protein
MTAKKFTAPITYRKGTQLLSDATRQAVCLQLQGAHPFIAHPCSLNPIWTVKTCSLFLWTVYVKDLFLSDGLHCIVFDFDQVSANEQLGQVYLSPRLLYEATGERMEFALTPPPQANDASVDIAGFLAVRCRRASGFDMRFMKELAETRRREKREEIAPELVKLKNIAHLATDSAGGAGNLSAMLSKRSKQVKNEDHPEGVTMVRVPLWKMRCLSCKE